MIEKFIRRVKKAFWILKTEGLKALLGRTKVFFEYKLKYRNAYQKWIKKNEKNLLQTESLDYMPLISVIVPVYNVKKNQLRECIESVIRQTVQNWELCLIDDASTMPEVREVLGQYEHYEKIKIKYREENGHICRASNDGIRISDGEFIAFLDCDDILAPNAIFEVTKMLNQNRTYDYIYSDEDFVTENGKKRYSPVFKPDWSPDTLMSMMYTCHFSVYRKTIAEKIGSLRLGYEGSQDFDFTLRFTEETDRIGHIPKILYHWRARKESAANNPEVKPYAFKAMEQAKIDALSRRKLDGKVSWSEKFLQYEVEYIDNRKPLISIVIPSRDNYKLLNQCIESIVHKVSYPNYEIIVVDNGSAEETKKKYEAITSKYKCSYIYEPQPFNFSGMCNRGAKEGNGEYYLFLNDDIEAIQGDFLERMEGQAALAHVGAVGAKLLYPNSDIIQHSGVVNYETGPGHCFMGQSNRNIYYAARNVVTYNYIAVTGACLMIGSKKFWDVGGFDESLPVAYNDVELCFRLVKAGYYNVLRNDVKLYHYESASRGLDEENPERRRRQLHELRHLYELHPDFKGRDPFYNPNLAQDREDFSLNMF